VLARGFHQRGSRVAVTISSWLWLAWARMRPKGSQMKLPPQKSIPELQPPSELWSPGRDLGGGAVGFGEDHVAVLVAHAVDRADEDSIGDGVGALDGLPRGVLRRAELGLLAGVPADRGGMKIDCAPSSAVRRAASGNHWSQQISAPTGPCEVGIARKPRSPGAK